MIDHEIMDLNVTPIVGGLPTRRTSLDSTPREAPEAATRTTEPARAPGERVVHAAKANEGADAHGHDLSRDSVEIPEEVDVRGRAEVVDPRNQPSALVQEISVAEQRALDALEPRRQAVKDEAAELRTSEVEATDASTAADLARVDAEENVEASDDHVDEPGKPTPAEAAEIDDLRARDREVRTHEMAHSAAGGSHTGSPNYALERGPDGRMYAVGGDVSVDVSAVDGDPRATIAKMRQVHRAALAPAQPSGQDRAVAARAMAQLNQAQELLAAEETDRLSTDEEAPRSTSEVPGARGTVSAQEGNRAYLSASSSGDVAAPGEQLDVMR